MSRGMILVVKVVLVVAVVFGVAQGGTVMLVKEGRPVSAIVVAASPTIAANLAAIELQYHIEAITGAVVPIKSDAQAIEAGVVRILVGESAITREIGFKIEDFKLQEYLIDANEERIVLLGRDWLDTPANRAETGNGIADSLSGTRKKINYTVATGRDGAKEQIVELPGLLDEQGTCYATYDFLERFCDVRWYGPAMYNNVVPSRKTLTVPTGTIRRSPSIPHRYAPDSSWPILREQWGPHHDIQQDLFLRRIRYGGERWGCNHSFSSWRDRFLVKHPERSELFEGSHPEYFAVGWENEGDWRQPCLTNPAVVEQVIKDAREYFDGKGIRGVQFAVGDYFSIVPCDTDHWCKCQTCQAILEKGKSRDIPGHFGTGAASDYVFGFVNAVAKEVKKTHPDKFISALAYACYSYPPTFELESNVAVAPCVVLCYGYCKSLIANDEKFYSEWIEESKSSGRRLYMWNYFSHQVGLAIAGGWKCFPGFMPDVISTWVKRYAHDGIRGFYICGLPQQLDFCLYMQTAFNADTECMQFTDEFFARYFGAAAEPMKKFHWRISEINKEEGILGGSPKESWGKLGTEERMKELGELMGQAVALASTDMEKRRVDSWKRGVWDYMASGRSEYVKEQLARGPKQLVIGVYSSGVDDERRLLAGGALDTHWQLVESKDGKWAGPGVYAARLEQIPSPPWLKQETDAKSQWITPSAEGVDVVGGRYVYEQKFKIDETMNLATASVFGRIVGDDVVESVEINGVKINAAEVNCDRWLDLLIMEHLVAGENTLRVIVKNDGEGANPHGVRVELTGGADKK